MKQTVTVSLAAVKVWVRQLASLAGLVVSIANADHLPTNVRAVLLAGSLWIQRAQHDVDVAAAAAKSNPTTGGS